MAFGPAGLLLGWSKAWRRRMAEDVRPTPAARDRQLGRGQVHHLRQAAGGAVADAHPAPGALDDLPRYRETEAGSGRGLAARRVGAEKRLEHLPHKILRYPRPSSTIVTSALPDCRLTSTCA